MNKEALRAIGVNTKSGFPSFVSELLYRWGVSNLHLEGEQNLAIARDLNAQGKSLVVIANHMSNSEGKILDKIFEEYGFKCPVFLAGNKLRQNPITNVMVGAVNSIDVWPPSLKPKNPEEEELRRVMNKKAVETAREVLLGGHPLFVFPEGSRSYDAVLHEALPQIAQYFCLTEEINILPVGIRGTEKLLPRKAAIPRRGKPVYFSFGELMEAEKLPGYGVRSRVARKSMIEPPMLAIARLIPEEYRGAYKDRVPVSFDQKPEIDLVPSRISAVPFRKA